MRVLNSFGAVIVLGAVLGACGASATQGPDGGGPTQGPNATEAGGGGGGGGDTSHGKVTYSITGPIQKNGELGFIPAASLFGGDQGSVLNFGDTAGSGQTLSIVIGPDGSVVASYIGPEGQVPGATCTTSNWNVGAGQASGTFDCTASITITASGASVQGGKITGSFTANS